VDRLVRRLKAYDAGKAAPKTGEPMPPFAMPDEQGHLVRLDVLLAEGPLAMTFHRGHWCPYCRINTRAFAEAQERIASKGANLAAIMPDRQRFAALLKAEGEARYPELTDIDNGYALSLNLAIWVGDEMQRFSNPAAGSSPTIRGITRGSCQFRRPSSLPGTALSLPASSTPTSASAWPSRTCSRRCKMPNRKRKPAGKLENAV